MTTTGKVFVDPVSGETLCFSKTSLETGGELVEIEVNYRAKSPRPPLHYHPHQSEHFEIVAGSMTVQINGKQQIYHEGESFDVPQGSAHTMWNDGEETAQFIWQIRPALNSEAFLETVWGLKQEGRFVNTGKQNLLQSAVLMQTYEREFRLVHPSRAVQKMLFPPLAFIGRLLGYQGRYEKYSGKKARA